MVPGSSSTSCCGWSTGDVVGFCRSGQSAFTPVAPSTLSPQSRQKLTTPPPVEQPQQEVEDEPGTIVHPQSGQPASPPPQNAAPNLNPRPPASR